MDKSGIVKMMRLSPTVKWLFILLILILFFCIVFFILKPKTSQYVPPILKPVSDEVTKKYQKVNASLLECVISRPFYGPHEGPGIVSGVGPILIIQWFKKDTKELKTIYKRTIPISSIISVDENVDSLSLNTVVYYAGPMGEIEYAICNKDFGEKIINRWKSYLLSQESTN